MKFEEACQIVTDGDFEVSVKIKLLLYGFYKVATVGNCEGKKPSAMNIVDHAKFCAWEKASDLTQQESKQAYVQLVKKLQDRAQEN